MNKSMNSALIQNIQPSFDEFIKEEKEEEENTIDHNTDNNNIKEEAIEITGSLVAVTKKGQNPPIINTTDTDTLIYTPIKRLFPMKKRFVVVKQSKGNTLLNRKRIFSYRYVVKKQDYRSTFYNTHTNKYNNHTPFSTPNNSTNNKVLFKTEKIIKEKKKYFAIFKIKDETNREKYKSYNLLKKYKSYKYNSRYLNTSYRINSSSNNNSNYPNKQTKPKFMIIKKKILANKNRTNINEIIDLKVMNDKYFITNSDIVLALLEITYNSNSYDFGSKKYPPETKKFWDQINVFPHFDNILKDYTESTLRKYWNYMNYYMSNFRSLDRLIEKIKSTKDEIDSYNLKLKNYYIWYNRIL